MVEFKDLKPLPEGNPLPVRRKTECSKRAVPRSRQDINADRTRIGQMLMRKLSNAEIIAVQRNRTDCSIATIKSDIAIVKKQQRSGVFESARFYATRNLEERLADLEDIVWVENELKKAWEITKPVVGDPDAVADTSILKALLAAKKMKHATLDSMIDVSALLQLPSASEQIEVDDFVQQQKEALTFIDRRPQRLDVKDFPRLSVLPKIKDEESE